MIIVADTNVVIRAVLGDDQIQSRIARSVLARASGIVVTLPTLCEIAWTLRSHYRASKSEIYETIARLIEDPKIICDRQAVTTGLDLLENGGDFADGVIAYEARRLGGSTFCSFDRQACRLLSQAGLGVELLGE